ncbi:MAG: radical SAM protein [Clostridia bacterium]|nr:radical SAM protein [Clostridia bacterium]
MSNCRMCPRKCGADRTSGISGVCKTDDNIYISRAAPHFWEEPCISGKNGSGTVFFSGCNLGCVYCQNRKISRFAVGKAISVSELAETFVQLQESGVHNINLVTPSHYIKQIRDALDLAKLQIPVVYNSSGYDLCDALEMLDGKVRVFLPDFKYMSGHLAQKFSSAKDYPEVAKASIKKMFELAGKPRFDADGMIKSGVIVRHLVLPGHTDDSKEIIRYLHDTYGDSIYLCIMNQFTPSPDLPFDELTRPLNEEEYNEVVDFAISIGVKNAFIQEGETAKESFIPDFEI